METQLNKCIDVGSESHHRKADPDPEATSPEQSDLWLDLEHFIASTHTAWLLFLGFVLVLLAFVVTGFVLVTAVLLVTFYLFICEQQHIESLQYSW